MVLKTCLLFPLLFCARAESGNTSEAPLETTHSSFEPYSCDTSNSSEEVYMSSQSSVSDAAVNTEGSSEVDASGTADDGPDLNQIVEVFFGTDPPSLGDLPGAEAYAAAASSNTSSDTSVDRLTGAGEVGAGLERWGPELAALFEKQKDVVYNILQPPPFVELPYVVRCPNGWTAAGPYCSAVLRASPYTECVDQKKRLKEGNKVKAKPVAVAICSETFEEGANIRCPPGYTFFTPEEPIPNDVFSPVIEDELRLPESDVQLMCVGFSIESLSLSNNKTCDRGYAPSKEGCQAVARVPPEVSCPIGWSLTFTPTNPYAFKGKQYAYCSRDVLTKGRFWCPPSFYPYAEPYPDLVIGELIPPGTNVTYSDVEFGYGFLVPPGVPQSSCIQIATVPYEDCDELECNSEALSEAKSALKKWTYYVLESDPFVGYKEGIPSGKDWRLTTSHMRSTY